VKSHRLRREGGSALIVTVLLLVMLGVIGLAALDTVTRDQQVAGFQNRSRLAFYAAEAGVADAKERLRAVFSTDAVVNFPDNANAVDLGDAGMFPYGQPSYYGDPSVARAVTFMDAGALDLGSGMDLREGGEQWINTLWRIRVEGSAPGGTTARLDVVATRSLSGGMAY
jgi:hypothetical protein